MRATDDRTTRFRWLIRDVDVRAGKRVDLPLLSVSSSKGVVRRSDLTDALPRAEDLSNYKRCDAGDIVLNRMSAYQGALGLAKQAGIVSPDYAVLRPTPRVNERYVAYLMRSDWFVGQMTLRLRGIGAPGATSVRTPRVNVDELGEIPVALPELESQRSVADFLDDQVARIDSIIAARRHQTGLLIEVEEAELEKVIWADRDVGGVLLRRLETRVTTGPFGTVFAADAYVTDGIPMINPTHIVGGRMIPDPHHSVGPETASRLVRHQLHAGDIVTGRKGDIGRSAVVEEAQDGWICGSDSIAIHADTERLLPAFLDLVLHLPRVRAELVSHSPGATMPSLNEGMLLSVSVPAISVAMQHERVRAGVGIRTSLAERRAQLEGSIQRLEELKQSLITAAVTGEFDASFADRSRVAV
jgi:type I restriction enzyme S subunit